MRTTVAVLALLVCVTRAAPLHDGQDEAPTETAVDLFENKQQTEQFGK